MLKEHHKVRVGRGGARDQTWLIDLFSTRETLVRKQNFRQEVNKSRLTPSNKSRLTPSIEINREVMARNDMKRVPLCHRCAMTSQCLHYLLECIAMICYLMLS